MPTTFVIQKMSFCKSCKIVYFEKFLRHCIVLPLVSFCDCQFSSHTVFYGNVPHWASLRHFDCTSPTPNEMSYCPVLLLQTTIYKAHRVPNASCVQHSDKLAHEHDNGRILYCLPSFSNTVIKLDKFASPRVRKKATRWSGLLGEQASKLGEHS